MSNYIKGREGSPNNRTFYNLIATALSVGAVAFSIYALSGQTGDLLGFFDSSENKIAGVEADGTFYGPDFTSRYDEAGEFSLNDFYDFFDFSSLSDGDIFIFNSSTQKFEPSEFTATSPGGSTGAVQFRDSNGDFAGDGGLYYDSVNNRLGIDTGGVAPDSSLTIGSSSVGTDHYLRMYRSGGGQLRLYLTNTQVGFYGTKDMYIATNAGGREIYLVPEGLAVGVLESRGMAYGNTTLPTTTTFYIESLGTSGEDVLHVANSSASSLLKVEEDGEVVQKTPNAVPADGELFNGSISWYLDESAGELKAKVKYSDGTIKTATLSLP